MLDVILVQFERLSEHNIDTRDPLYRTVLLTIMTLGGLLAVEQGAMMVSNLFGVGAGLESMSSMLSMGKTGMSRATRGLRRTGSATTRGIGRGTGMRGKDANGQVSYGSKNMRMAGLTGSEKRQSSMALASGGKIAGTSQGYKKYVNHKASTGIAKAKTKESVFNAKAAAGKKTSHRGFNYQAKATKQKVRANSIAKALKHKGLGKK